LRCGGSDWGGEGRVEDGGESGMDWGVGLSGKRVGRGGGGGEGGGGGVEGESRQETRRLEL